MATRYASELQPTVDADQATRHLELLHEGAQGFISLNLLGNNRPEAHSFTSVDELSYADDVAASVEALQDVVNDRWNVYTACASFTSVPERGRGRRDDVQSIPGVWADLDVKPGADGYFQDQAELDNYVKLLPKPTLQVNSGSGGRHLYWLVHTNQRPEGRDGEQLLIRWRDFLLAEAGGYAIDHVHDTVRILRLAGTVRWPKGDERNATPQLVTIHDLGPRYHADELRMLSDAAHEEAVQLRREIAERRRVNDEGRRRDVSSRGLDLEDYDRIVATFNRDQDWEPLLKWDGWKLNDDVRGGISSCRYWTRPGKDVTDGKSAATDWTDAQGYTRRVMTIYSRDPSLEDLFEHVTERGQVICSKWVFALKRIYHGDEAALIRCVVQGRGKLI